VPSRLAPGQHRLGGSTFKANHGASRTAINRRSRGKNISRGFDGDRSCHSAAPHPFLGPSVSMRGNRKKQFGVLSDHGRRAGAAAAGSGPLFSHRSASRKHSLPSGLRRCFGERNGAGFFSCWSENGRPSISRCRGFGQARLSGPLLDRDSPSCRKTGRMPPLRRWPPVCPHGHGPVAGRGPYSQLRSVPKGGRIRSSHRFVRQNSNAGLVRLRRTFPHAPGSPTRLSASFRDYVMPGA